MKKQKYHLQFSWNSQWRISYVSFSVYLTFRYVNLHNFLRCSYISLHIMTKNYNILKERPMLVIKTFCLDIVLVSIKLQFVHFKSAKPDSGCKGSSHISHKNGFKWIRTLRINDRHYWGCLWDQGVSASGSGRSIIPPGHPPWTHLLDTPGTYKPPCEQNDRQAALKHNPAQDVVVDCEP